MKYSFFIGIMALSYMNCAEKKSKNSDEVKEVSRVYQSFLLEKRFSSPKGKESYFDEANKIVRIYDFGLSHENAISKAFSQTKKGKNDFYVLLSNLCDSGISSDELKFFDQIPNTLEITWGKTTAKTENDSVEVPKFWARINVTSKENLISVQCGVSIY